MKKFKALFIIGTRPEAIKICPVVKTFNDSIYFETRIIETGQHKELVEDVLKLFNLKSDINLKIMLSCQTLEHITQAVLNGVTNDIKINRPDIVLVQGDTTSAMAAALAAFYESIPIAHIEAGLRTNDIYEPFPEEMNRRIISQLSSIHLSPTKNAKDNLVKANILGKISITGNTVIDSLLFISKKNSSFEIKNLNFEKDKFIFATIHRRENWEKLESISDGLKNIINFNSDIKLLIAVHPNPVVKNKIKKLLGSNPRIFLVKPLKYHSLVKVLKKCILVLTDSGGLQEEAPSFGKPVLVLRNNTERYEAVEAGSAKLIGTKSEDIFKQTNLILSDQDEYKKMSLIRNPFGDGNASQKILKICLEYLDRPLIK